MEVNLLDGRTFNGFTISVALVSAIIAAFALLYGRRAVFPPKRRLTIFIHPSRNSTAITISNTGRHAVESARFDGNRPLAIDLRIPLRHVDVITAPRPDMRLKFHGSTVTFGPDLLNRGDTITTEIETAGTVVRKAAQVSNVLVDTAIDTKWRRPPGRVRRYAPRVALLLPLLYFSSIAWFNGRADVVSYVVSGPSASISPDSGPSSGCVTVRGKNYTPDEKITVVTYDFPPGTKDDYPTPAGCPALVRGRGETRSSVKGEILFSFGLPPGCSGMLTIWVDGSRYDAVTYWVT